MPATVPAATLLGVDGQPVTVEVHVANGLPSFTVVGLPDTSCREARDRVRAALQSCDIEFPLRRVTVNLAPSGLRKAGAVLDLAIAVGLLVAGGHVPEAAVEGLGFLGELGLDGTLRAVPGIVPLVDALSSPGVVVPPGAVADATLVGRHHVLSAPRLSDLLAVLRGETTWPDPPAAPVPPPAPPAPDLADVRGQPAARFALEVAAAGGHHLLMVGPPGAGKTMLASRLPGLLPPLGAAPALEVTRIRSAAGLPIPVGALSSRPPFRAPHHSASLVSLVGGGSATVQPGEVSLAHRGVLFLDELGEFAPAALEALRQPLEDGLIRVSRAHVKVTLPARFLLVGASNPCPCGEGGPPGACRCGPASRQRYARRMSGPLLDRFDLRLEVGRPAVPELLRGEPGESTAVVSARVGEARARAAERGVPCNAELSTSRLDAIAPLSAAAEHVLEGALVARRLSGRGLQRVRRVALTIADLAGESPPLGPHHVTLALAMRAEPQPVEVWP